MSALGVPGLAPTSQYSELGTRLASSWRDILRAFQSSGLIGHGTGTASLGLQYIASYWGGWGNPALYNVEGGYASVIWEWGIVGLVLWLLWSVFLLMKLIGTVRKLRPTPFYWLAISVTLYSFFQLFLWFYLGIQVYQQYVAQAFLWFLAGVVFRLPSIAGVPQGFEIARTVGRFGARDSLQGVLPGGLNG